MIDCERLVVFVSVCKRMSAVAQLKLQLHQLSIVLDHL